MKRNFRLQQSALMLALAAAYPVLGYSAAGTTQFTAGDVTVKRGNAAPAPLAKGAAVESGDSIVTGARGVAQLKFSDGGYVAIQPNSQFDLTRYADAGNASQDNFLVSLARGGMRAITGLIGKRNTANYKVTTNTATVGIRGSAFNLAYNADGTLSVATEQDAIEVCTAAGCIGLTAGESALVNNNQSLPVRTDVRSTMPTAPYRQDPVVAGNQVNGDGTAAILPVVPRVLTGIAFAGAGLVSGEGTYANVFGSGDGALTVQGGRPTNYLSSSDGQGALSEGGTTEVHATQGSLQTGDYLVLGTWSSGTWDNAEGSYVHTPLAFVAGVPTSSAAISSLSGSNATYSLRVATPVYSDSNYGGFVGTLNSANLGVDFTTGLGNIDLSIGMNYQGQYGTGSTIYSYSGSVSSNGARFSGGISGSGYGRVEGFFSGSNAQSAGISYGAYTDYNGYIAGAAILGRDTLTTPPVTITGNFVSGVVYDAGEGINAGLGDTTSLKVQSQNYSNVVGLQGGTSGYENTGVVNPIYVVGQPTDAAYLNLGTWSNSQYVYTGEGAYTEPVGAASYIVGRPTSSGDIDMLVLGNMTGTYNLLQATPVTMSNGGSGQLNSANLTMNFGSGAGSINLGLTLDGTAHSMGGNVNATGSSFVGTGLAITGGEGGFYGQVEGFFSGSSAEYAGITYSGYATQPGAYFGGAAILSGGTGSPGFAPQAGTYSSGLVSTFSAAASDPSAWYNNFPNQAFGSEHTFSSGAGDTFLSEAKTGLGLPMVSYGGGSATFNYTGNADGANPDFIGWGTWSSGSATYSGGSVGLSNVHYVVGSPTPSADIAQLNTQSATLTYNLAGGTAPTSTLGGTGTLDTATLTANFGSYTASASVVTKFGGNLYPITVNGMSIDQATATFNGIMGNDRMTGLFVGSMAAKAGLSYTSTSYSGTLGTITGAAVFNQVQPN